jgi:hypothetical protein
MSATGGQWITKWLYDQYILTDAALLITFKQMSHN